MIDHYSFGSITIQGKHYRSDLKVIKGQVYPDWWRQTGHNVDIDDVADILDAKPDIIVIGSGNSGLMKVSDRLKNRLEERGIEVIVEPTSEAVETFNRLFRGAKSVAAGFHLTC